MGVACNSSKDCGDARLEWFGRVYLVPFEFAPKGRTVNTQLPGGSAEMAIILSQGGNKPGALIDRMGDRIG